MELLEECHVPGSAIAFFGGVDGEVGDTGTETEFTPDFDVVEVDGDLLAGFFVDEAFTIFGEEDEA